MFNIDVAIVVIFLIVTLGVGLYHGRNVKNIRDYALGGRNFSTATLSATIIATWMSGSDFIVLMTYSYLDGILLFLSASGDVFNLLLVGFVIVPRMREFLGKLSVAEVMGDLYGKNIRIITSVLGVVVSSGWIGSQLIIISSVFAYFNNIPHNIALVTSAIALITYSAFGGIRSVTFTDVVQFIIFIIVIPSLGIMLWNHLNHDIVNASDIIYNHAFSFVSVSKIDYISLFVINLIPSLNPTIFQRILLGRSLKQVSSAFYISSLACFVIFAISSFIGIMLFAYDGSIDEKEIFGFLVDNFMPIGFKGLALVSVLAMTMSTVDSHLNAASVTFAHDIIKPLYPKGQYTLFFSRVFSVFLGVLSLILAMNFENLLELVLFANNFYMPIITVPLILAILGFRSTTKSVLIGMMAGFIAVILWKWQLQSSTGLDSLIPGMLANLVFFVGSHYLLNQSGGWVGPKDEVILNNISSERTASWLNFKKSCKNILNAIITLNPAAYNIRINHSDTSYMMLGILMICSYSTIMVSSEPMVNEFYPKIIQFLSLGFSGLLITYSLWSRNLSENSKSSFGFSCILFLLFSSFLMMMTRGFIISSVITVVINIIVSAMLIAVMELSGLILVSASLSWAYYTYMYGALVYSPYYSGMLVLVYSVFAISVIIFTFLRAKQNQITTLEESKTHLKRLTEVLNSKVEARERSLKKALDIHADILRNINHEIKTPMSALMSNAELLKDTWRDPKLHNYMDNLIEGVSESVIRFSDYASNLIDLSQYKTNKMLFDIKSSNLRSLLEEFSSSNIFLNYHTSLPSKLEFDEIKIKQVFANVIDNANKYSDGSDIEIIVSDVPDILFDNKPWKAIKIVIKDSGIGIPPEELEKIFEPFALSAETADGSGGRGLGLALSREIVSNHFGSIYASNNLDKGANIQIILPITHPRAKFLGGIDKNDYMKTIDLQQIIIDTKKIDDKYKDKIPKILMIDDDPSILSAGSLIIKGLGYEFIGIATGEEAEKYINSNEFNAQLIFLDMMLGDTDGLAVMKKVTEKLNFFKVPVIIQSGLSADDPNIVETLKLGAKAFMGKPYSRKDIDDVIKKYLG